MKRSISIFSYPVILIETGGELVWTCPDFGLYKAIKLPQGKKISTATAAQIAFSWLALMRLLYQEIKKKESAGKHLPKPSTPSSLFDFSKLNEKTYSPSEAAKKTGFSVNTIRRALDSGLVKCTYSPGGHRALTEIQIEQLSILLKQSPKLRHSNPQSREDSLDRAASGPPAI